MKFSNFLVPVFIGITLYEVSDVAFWANRFIPGMYSVILIFLSCIVLITTATVSFNKCFDNMPSIYKKLFIFYWFFSLFTITYGTLNAEAYYDYRHVFVDYVPSVIVSLSILVGLRHVDFFLPLFKFIFKFILPLALIFSFFVWFFVHGTVERSATAYMPYHKSVSRMSLSIYLFVLAFPWLNFRARCLVFILSIICILIDLEWRFNILRISICWFIVLVYYSNFLKPRFLNFIASLLVILPLFLLYLGIEGSFDVFTVLSGTDLNVEIDKSNTRTWLYNDVITTMQNRGTSFWYGGGAQAGYIPDFMYFSGRDFVFTEGRTITEVAFLNILMKSGYIGIIIYFFILLIPAYYAVNQSNNDYCKVLGFYLVFIWVFTFLEHIQKFNANHFIIYLIIGICVSSSFRNLTNNQVKEFFNEI